MDEKRERARCSNTKAPKQKKLIYALYRNRMVPIGYIKDNTFYRKCQSSQLYRAMGGSLGVDISVADQLKAEGVLFLQVNIQDWKNNFRISLSKFISLAKPRSFYGIKRLHLPFAPYWDEVSKREPHKKPGKQLNITTNFKEEQQ